MVVAPFGFCAVLVCEQPLRFIGQGSVVDVLRPCVLETDSNFHTQLTFPLPCPIAPSVSQPIIIHGGKNVYVEEMLVGWTHMGGIRNIYM